jgi:hypothetical protein
LGRYHQHGHRYETYLVDPFCGNDVRFPIIGLGNRRPDILPVSKILMEHSQ